MRVPGDYPCDFQVTNRLYDHFISSGFAVADPVDDQVVGEDGVRTLSCGTEKEKHKCKNKRTAGA